MNGLSTKRCFGVFALMLSSAVGASTFTEPSPEAFASAESQMSALDRAMTDGVTVLKAGDLKAIGAHSRQFASLVNAGKELFGSSLLEPLGRCSSAGTYAQSWWSAQVSAARKGGVESIPGSIQDTLDQFKINRTECLKDSQPVTSAELDSKRKEKVCLTVFGVDPKTKEVVPMPKPVHCKS